MKLSLLQYNLCVCMCTDVASYTVTICTHETVMVHLTDHDGFHDSYYMQALDRFITLSANTCTKPQQETTLVCL